jgi:hypothetical protein
MRVAWNDPATGVVFGLVPGEPPTLSAWDGTSWIELAKVPEPPAPVEGLTIPSEAFYSGYADSSCWSYDTTTRRLILVEGAAFLTTSELPIGDLIDGAPRPAVTTAKPKPRRARS